MPPNPRNTPSLMEQLTQSVSSRSTTKSGIDTLSYGVPASSMETDHPGLSKVSILIPEPCSHFPLQHVENQASIHVRSSCSIMLSCPCRFPQQSNAQAAARLGTCRDARIVVLHTPKNTHRFKFSTAASSACLKSASLTLAPSPPSLLASGKDTDTASRPSSLSSTKTRLPSKWSSATKCSNAGSLKISVRQPFLRFPSSILFFSRAARPIYLSGKYRVAQFPG